jgi:H+-transporting ATPase
MLLLPCLCCFSRYETIKAADAVAALKASLKPTATVKRDGSWQNIDAKFLVPGDMVLLGAGSAVPADCLINDGRLEVDQSALTGESLPVTMYRGDSAKMGSTAVRGEVEATVEVRGGVAGWRAVFLQVGMLCLTQKWVCQGNCEGSKQGA